ncbi:hypothetical protein AB0F13_13240 [Streptomyces sp. NPDC026206]|uniref:hypothetical protein n=1 Tax=Streptomyces sp. NPDC026206 TaxID=3157089 RepID=UPI0033C5B370
MKKLLEGLGALLVVQGLVGIVHWATGWFRYFGLIRHLGFLHGYEIYASAVLAVLGVALVLAADAGRRGSAAGR